MTMNCGCQRRIASNGASVCSSCIGSYEISLSNKNRIVPVKKDGPPVFPGITPTTNPSNVTIQVSRR